MERTPENRPTGTTTTVVEIWAFVDPAFANIDFTGWSVEAKDGKIGKVDDATMQAGGGFFVVDTGPLIFGKKVVLPAGLIERIDLDTETVFVNRTKDEIKSAPEYDSDLGVTNEYRRDLGGYYGR
jgi:hypothetical protein